MNQHDIKNIQRLNKLLLEYVATKYTEYEFEELKEKLDTSSVSDVSLTLELKLPTNNPKLRLAIVIDNIIYTARDLFLKDLDEDDKFKLTNIYFILLDIFLFLEEKNEQHEELVNKLRDKVKEIE